MNVEQQIEQAAANAFIAALLISGSSLEAERIVLEAIESSTISEIPTVDFQMRVAHLSLRNARDARDKKGNRDELDMALPAELCAVFRLPAELRQCLIFCVLLALPPAACSALLRVDQAGMNETTVQALLALAASYQGTETQSIAMAT